MMLKLSNKLVCSTNCYHGFDLDTALVGISKVGFSYVELTSVRDYTEHVMPEHMTDRDLENLIAKLNAHHLTPISLSGHSDLTVEEGVESIKKRIDFAKNLNIEIVNSSPGTVEEEAHIPKLISNLKNISKYAEQRGVVLALETHGLVMGSGEGASKIVRMVDSPWIKINYDTGNAIFYAGVRPEEDIKKALEYLAHIHLKDKKGGKGVWDFPAIGSGEIDFENIFQTLIDGGFEGPISLEVEVVGKGEIPTWLVPENATVGGIIEDESRKDTAIIDQALKQSYEYVKQFF